jgi:cobalt-precorrin-5B (C1)-methyltransferase
MRKRSSQSKEERPLRQGYTTGTCAAAAAWAAARAVKSIRKGDGKVYRKGSDIMVNMGLPQGGKATMSARIVEAGRDHAVASVIKYAGDDPDVTDGAEIIARVRITKSKAESDKSEGVSKERGVTAIKGGRGVGRVTKPGLQIPVGEPAINPVPRRMIKEAVKEVLGDTPVEVIIEVPEGERLAEKTFNPRLGIVGGISIIGTTGIVEPMSLEALKAAVKCEIDVAAEETGVNSHSYSPSITEVGGRGLFLAPGKIGEDALKGLLGDIRVVQTSNFIGFALEYARDKGIKDIVYGGHPGKLAKILMGYYDTHSRNSPKATAFVAEYLGISGEFNTLEEIILKISPSSDPSQGEQGRGFSSLAGDIAEKIGVDFQFSHVEIYLFDMKKKLIGEGRWAG